MLSYENIAQICHEANRAYCESIGDFSQVSWNTAPEWQRTSAINGVRFLIENPNALPCHVHDKWLQKKLQDGWKFGPVKNPDTKEHPCCVPYENLSEEQQQKDYLFCAIVKSFY